MFTNITNDPNGSPLALTATLEDGSTFTCNKDQRHFPAAVQAVLAQDVDRLMGVIAPIRVLASHTSRYKELTIADGEIAFCDQVLKGDLIDHILDTIGAGMAFEPLVKALYKLQANPNPNVRENLWNFVANNKLAVTEDGDFFFYKHVMHDYQSWFTGDNPAQVQSLTDPDLIYEVESGKIPYFTGTVVTQDRDLVDPDPNKGCSVGLHVGSYGYHLWNDCRTLVVSVDPRDIVAVPHNNRHALRVCKITVLGELTTEGGALRNHGDIIYDSYLSGEQGITLDQSGTKLFWDEQTEEIVEEQTETTEPAHRDPNTGEFGQHPVKKFFKAVMSGKNPFKK